MMNKIGLIRSLLFAVLVCLLCWYAVLWLTDPFHRLPEHYREILLTGCLLWFATLFLDVDRDDDWAGEF